MSFFYFYFDQKKIFFRNKDTSIILIVFDMAITARDVVVRAGRRFAHAAGKSGQTSETAFSGYYLP